MSNSLRGKNFDWYDISKIKYTNFNCKNPNCKKKEYYKSDEHAVNNDRLSYINVNYSGKYIVIKTPPMTMPFKINNRSGSFTMNLQFTNYIEDEEMNNFYNFIKNLQISQVQHIGLDETTIDRYCDQIWRDKEKKYDPNLSVKVPFRYNKFECEAYNQDGDLINLLNINPFSKMQCDIYVDQIWLFNDSFICKWKVNKIQLL
jgi:hypothetical protein